MQKEAIKLFVQYNRAVNETMNSIIKTLTKAEWEKPMGGYFPSIRSLCSHLYIADFNWLKRFKNLRSFTVLEDSFFTTVYSFNETLFSDMEEYLVKRPDLDSRIIAFAGELTDDDLRRALKYTDSHGTAREYISGACVLQFLNHETHHRGGISVYLDMLGKDNDFSTFFQALK